MKRKRKKKSGSGLLDQIVKLSGIPGPALEKELRTILEKKGLDPKQLTLDQLRVVVASYLREIMSSIMESPPGPKPPPKDISH